MRAPHPESKNCRWLMLGAMGLLVSCGDPSSVAEQASTRQEVILSAMPTGYELNTGIGALATGAIFVPYFQIGGLPVLIPGTSVQPRKTCGVTFISPHFAITAAHCVEAQHVYFPEAQALVVETYDVSNLHSPLPTALGGFFPNYTHGWLGPADGYKVNRLVCNVAVRCVDPANNVNCPPASTHADIALIHCPERPATEDFPYLAVAATDQTALPVDVFWAHEILDVPNLKPPTMSAEQLDHYEHYKIFSPGPANQSVPGNATSNYHYHPDNQLLPLHATAFASGQQRQRTGERIGEVVMTDLFGCHGTSGSGVVQRLPNGEHELLGPVTRAHFGWLEPGTGRGLLCMDADQQVAGRSHLGYLDSSHTRALAVAAQADLDYWVSWFSVQSTLL